MLYYVKGHKPRVFNRDAVRIPIGLCRHCGMDVKDYGGHKKYLNPKGLNLSDVWNDVPPVRHSKFKNRVANELAPVVLERVILLSTERGDMIVDPFVGGGTTARIAEKLGRHWICGDINDCSCTRDGLRSGAPAPRDGPAEAQRDTLAEASLVGSDSVNA
jgi:site-specific DNA-methyltransferase (adenine-specific)